MHSYQVKKNQKHVACYQKLLICISSPETKEVACYQNLQICISSPKQNKLLLPKPLDMHQLALKQKNM